MHDVHLPAIDLNLLLVLDALLTERSVTRAAARLGLSQPAASHALRRLRDVLGDPLLVPGTGGMVPTPRAEELAAGLRRGLVELERALRGEARFEPATSTRVFHVASPDYPEGTAFPALFRRVAVEAPRVSLQLRPLGPGLRAELESGALDLVLAGREVEQQLDLTRGIVRALAVDEPFVTIVRDGNPRVGRSLDLRTFAALGHVLISTGGGGRGYVDQALAERGLERHVALRVPHFLGVPFVVASSDLVATVPRWVASEAAKVLPLRLLSPPLALPPALAYLYWHERASSDPGHAWMREAMLEAFAEGSRRPRRKRAAKPRESARIRTE